LIRGTSNIGDRADIDGGVVDGGVVDGDVDDQVNKTPRHLLARHFIGRM
jgi:hypothetical protein